MIADLPSRPKKNGDMYSTLCGKCCIRKSTVYFSSPIIDQRQVTEKFEKLAFAHCRTTQFHRKTRFILI